LHCWDRIAPTAASSTRSIKNCPGKGSRYTQSEILVGGDTVHRTPIYKRSRGYRVIRHSPEWVRGSSRRHFMHNRQIAFRDTAVLETRQYLALRVAEIPAHGPTLYIGKRDTWARRNGLNRHGSRVNRASNCATISPAILCTFLQSVRGVHTRRINQFAKEVHHGSPLHPVHHSADPRTTQ
jgi:hypothetical protein